jgi:alpha-beta hydrolase superfamily lysophospholipase
MHHSTDSFQTIDGLRIHTESWLPVSVPKAGVLIVHGIGEHLGRYQHVATFLVESGYAVYGLDHRTHGRSEGEPRVYVDDFDVPVNDLKQYFDLIRSTAPDTRIFLYGHSMGAIIGTEFVVRYQEVLSGFISSGSPLTFDATVPAIMTIIGKVLDRLVPTMPLVNLGLEYISSNPEVVAAYMSDPLVHTGRLRVRTAVLANQVSAPLRDRLPELHLPLLILHGGGDKMVPVSGSELLYDKASSTDKTLKIYPELYHEIHNEPQQKTVLSDIVNWLDQH